MATSQYGLFNVNPQSFQGAPKLTNSDGTGLINVVDDYSWTLSPKTARTETPTIELVEYKLKQSAIIAAFNRYAYALENGFETQNFPYYGLYPADKTGFQYRLPYFADLYRTITNAWENADALSEIAIANRIPIIGEYLGLHGLEAVAKAWHVGVGHEIPKGYTAGSAEALGIAFVLLNTTNIQDVKRNWEFLYLLSYQNLQNRKSFIVVDPPVIYTVRITGVKYSPAAYISNLAITNLGQMKKVIVDNREQHIPEAWGVVIALQDLIPQSQNMMEAMRAGTFSNIIATESRTTTEFLNQFTPPKT